MDASLRWRFVKNDRGRLVKDSVIAARNRHGPVTFPPQDLAYNRAKPTTIHETPVYSLIIDVIVTFLLGSMVFFAAVVTPTAFRALGPSDAGRYLRALFPPYYLWGIVLSVLALGVCIFHSPKGAALMTLVLAGFVYARQLLIPAINEARDRWHETDNPQDKARFRALHRRSVIINVAQMVMLVIIIIA